MYRGSSNAGRRAAGLPGCEADARRILGARLPVAHARLAHGHRPDAGQDLASGRCPVPHDAPADRPQSSDRRSQDQKLGHFRFDRLGQKCPRAIAQNLAQPVGQNPWLNQLDNVIVGHGIIAPSVERVKARADARDTPPAPISRPRRLSAIAFVAALHYLEGGFRAIGLDDLEPVVCQKSASVEAEKLIVVDHYGQWRFRFGHRAQRKRGEKRSILTRVAAACRRRAAPKCVGVSSINPQG